MTRTAEPLARVPNAVGVLDRADLQRAQPTVGLDEAFNNLPGVVVSQPVQLLARPADLDPRVRQPLQLRRPGRQDPAGRHPPDPARRPEPAHQRGLRRPGTRRGAARRQLVALRQRLRRGDLASRARAPRRLPSRSGCGFRAATGKRDGDGFYKWQSWSSGRSGNASGTLSISQFKADGFRQNSAADIRQLNAGLDYVFSGTTIGTVRLGLADNPEAQNPGALTKPELVANPDSAAANNIRRGADKDVQQQQLALGLRHVDDGGTSTGSTCSGCCATWRTRSRRRRRAPFVPTAGTYVRIDRAVGGARASGTRHLGAEATAPRLTAGRRHPADARRSAELRLRRGPPNRQRADRSAGDDHRVRALRAGAVVAAGGAAADRGRPLRLGPVRRGGPPPERRGGQQRPADQ